VSWGSSDDAVATVDNDGVVTGVAAGSAKITVTTEDGGKTATCTVTVKALSSIAITKEPTKKDYFIGEKIDLTDIVVTATYSGSPTTTGVVPVNNDMLDKAVFTEADAANAGSVTITVTYGEKTATFTVTVKYKITGVTVSPAEADVIKGQGKTFTATVDAESGTPPQTVTWSIVEAGKNGGTSINDEGELSVAAGETLDTLTVKAVSTYDTTKTSTATVNVTGIPTGITVSVPGGFSVLVGEEMDYGKITVTATYSGSPNKVISGIAADNLNPSKFTAEEVGTKEVTVTCLRQSKEISRGSQKRDLARILRDLSGGRL
jgi:uncharacterized protein YjdB